MQAWKLKPNGKVGLEKSEAVAPPEGFVKIKASYSLLSNMDIKLFEGKANPSKTAITLGNNATGLVSEVGEGVTGLERGDRVVLDPFICCRNCEDFKDSKCRECPDLKMYGLAEDGFLSDFILVRSFDAYKLPEHVEDKDAVFAPHIAFAVNVINKLQLNKGEHIVIVGASVVGIILAQLALYYQAIPILVDTRSDRLNIAENLGVYYCINSVNEDVKKKIFTLTGGSLASTVVYFPNGDNIVSKCLDYTSNGGRVCIAEWSGIQTDLTGAFNAILSKQLTVFGVNNGAKLIPAAINMLANKTVSVEGIVSSIVPFSDVDKALLEESTHPNKNIKLLIKG